MAIEVEFQKKILFADYANIIKRVEDTFSEFERNRDKDDPLSKYHTHMTAIIAERDAAVDALSAKLEG
jgi:hypothetical protein